MKSITLKIGRNEYDITSRDVFTDNGSCVCLDSQSKETLKWGPRVTPTLSKRAVKQISKFKRINIRHDASPHFQYFRLDIKKA